MMDIKDLRCLSIGQPFAEWIVTGVKRVENRDWSTHYRGPLLIHASSSKPDPDEDTLETAEEIGQSKSDLLAFPRGCVVGCVELATVIPRTRADGRVRGPSEFGKELEKCLQGFGEKLTKDQLEQQIYQHQAYWMDYWWILAKPRKLKTPIPCQGALKLWKPPESVLGSLLEEFDLCR